MQCLLFLIVGHQRERCEDLDEPAETERSQQEREAVADLSGKISFAIDWILYEVVSASRIGYPLRKLSKEEATEAESRDDAARDESLPFWEVAPASSQKCRLKHTLEDAHAYAVQGHEANGSQVDLLRKRANENGGEGYARAKGNYWPAFLAKPIDHSVTKWVDQRGDDNDNGLHWVERTRVHALVSQGHSVETDEVNSHVAHGELRTDDQLHKPCSEEGHDGSDSDLVHSFNSLFLDIVALK